MLLRRLIALTALLAAGCGDDADPAAAAPEASTEGMVTVAAGCFVRGAGQEGMPNERAGGMVQFRSFALDAHLVTAADYAAFLQTHGNQCDLNGAAVPCVECGGAIDCQAFTVGSGCQAEAGGAPDASCADHPASGVTWAGAAAYCASRGKRLPTEAEWERAAKGPGGDDCAASYGSFPWGEACPPSFLVEDLPGPFQAFLPACQAPEWTREDARLNCAERDCNDGFMTTSPVGAFPPTAEGFYDLVGNVQQWVQDSYHDSHAGAPTDAGAWLDGGRGRVRRGASFIDGGQATRTTYRVMDVAHRGLDFVGFRCALDLDEPTPAHGTAADDAPAEALGFERDMVPILSERCGPCHVGGGTQGCVGGGCLSNHYEVFTGWFTCCDGPIPGEPAIVAQPKTCATNGTVAACVEQRMRRGVDDPCSPMPPGQMALMLRWFDAGMPP